MEELGRIETAYIGYCKHSITTSLPMPHFDAIVAILLALAPGVISPGPNFLLAARVSFRGSLAQALACALGFSIGSVAFAIAGISGLTMIIRQWPIIDVLMKILGAIYLSWLGLETIRHARKPLALYLSATVETRDGRWRYFAAGLFTQLSNVKGIAIYGSVFAAFLPEELETASITTLLSAIFLLELSWYSLVVIVLNRKWARDAYLRKKTLIDIAAGLAMLLISFRLVSLAI